MKEAIAVFIGGGLGSLARYGVGRWIGTFHNHHFPFGTFMVNITACFALGFIIGIADHKQIISPAMRLFLAVGFCGGYSTFSSFSIETLRLFQQGHNLSLILYVFGSLLLCVTSTFGGLWIAGRM